MSKRGPGGLLIILDYLGSSGTEVKTFRCRPSSVRPEEPGKAEGLFGPQQFSNYPGFFRFRFLFSFDSSFLCPETVNLIVSGASEVKFRASLIELHRILRNPI